MALECTAFKLSEKYIFFATLSTFRTIPKYLSAIFLRNILFAVNIHFFAKYGLRIGALLGFIYDIQSVPTILMNPVDVRYEPQQFVHLGSDFGPFCENLTCKDI